MSDHSSMKKQTGFTPLEGLDLFKSAGLEKPDETPKQRLIAELVDTLRAARKHSGRTQDEIAKLSGISQPSIARLESHGNTRLPNLDTISRYLGACGYALAAIPKIEAGGRALFLPASRFSPGMKMAASAGTEIKIEAPDEKSRAVGLEE